MTRNIHIDRSLRKILKGRRKVKEKNFVSRIKENICK
jgi:hypothetical protein